MTFLLLTVTCVIGGFLSFLLSFIFLKFSSKRILANMVSLAVGSLLGTAFLEVIPHAVALSNNVHKISTVILIGIFALFILEKFFIWRHCHGLDCKTHNDEIKIKKENNSLVILVGNCFHNFIDGILIASAFLVNINLGILTAFAIYAHELPQEISNLTILVHSGLKKSKALLFNLISSLSILAGAVVAFFILENLKLLIPYILAFSASTMIYISVSDLIPDLHKNTKLSESFIQIFMISIGLSIIFIVHNTAH